MILNAKPITMPFLSHWSCLVPALSSLLQHATPPPVVQWAVREWGGIYEERYLGKNIFVVSSVALFGVRCGCTWYLNFCE